MKIFNYIKKVFKNIMLLDCATNALKDYKFLPSEIELKAKVKVYENVLDRLL